MNKLLLFSMALMMSLVLASSFGIAGQSVFAQNYGYKDNYPDDRYSYSDDRYSYPDDRYSYSDNRYGNHDDFKKFKFDFYIVFDDTPATTPTTELISTATCDKGDDVTGGGFKVVTGPTTEVDVTLSIPFENQIQHEEGWTAAGTPVSEDDSTPPRASLTAYAVCFDNKEHKYNSGGFD